MPRSFWIPATLLGLGVGVIGLLSLRKGSAVEACATCAAVTVSEQELAPIAPVQPSVVKPQPAAARPTPCDPSTPVLEDDEAPDFRGIGIELVRTRHLMKLPSREEKVTPEDLQARMARQLAGFFPEGYGMREGRALAALGAIPMPVDTVAQRAASWAQILGAWYDPETDAMLLAHEDRDGVDQEHALGQAFAFLVRERGDWLKKEAAVPSTDAWLAHTGLLAGDAAFTSVLHAASPAFKKMHPNRAQAATVDFPTHDFLRDLDLATFNDGENFAKGLHHLGDFDQLNAAYERPPVATAELLDAGLYFSEQQFEPKSPKWADLKVSGQAPFWDDTMGELGMSVFLEQQVPQNVAEEAVAGWTGDRWLAFEAPGGARGHIAWQTFWKDKPAADKFYSAMQQYLRGKHPEAPSAAESPGPWQWSAGGRSVILARTDGGRGVFYADAGTPDFAQALWKNFATP